MNPGIREEIMFTSDNKEIFDCVRTILMAILETSVDISNIKVSSAKDTTNNIIITYSRKLNGSWQATIDRL